MLNQTSRQAKYQSSQSLVLQKFSGTNLLAIGDSSNVSNANLSSKNFEDDSVSASTRQAIDDFNRHLEP